MAHFAKLDDNNVVIEVNVVNNKDINNLEFPFSESVGIKFLENWSGGYKKWRQTSYSGSFRKNFAAIGYTFDERNDGFVPPKYYDSWVLNKTTCLWEPPVLYPDDGKNYFWDEDSVSWVEITN